MKTKKILVLVLVALVLLALTAAVAASAEVAQGACCLPDGNCLVTVQGACDGEWLGPGTTCNECPGTVGGVTEPLQASALVLPAIVVGALVAAGAATTLLVKRRAA
jgi:hypothetical protein